MLRGLADPVADSQAVFRALLEAMSRPGRVVDVPRPLDVPAALHPAAAATCLALVDLDTPLWLDAGARAGEVAGYLRFHCGARIVEAPAEAAFALVTDAGAIPPLDVFAQGSDEEPERSATVIVQVAALDGRGGCRLTGPGVAGEARLRASGVPAIFWSGLGANHAAFPRGVDLVLVAGARLAALPRTTRVEV